MVMSWIWTGLLAMSLLCALITQSGSQLASATAQGAAEGITLAISMAGSICLWSGVGKLMEKSGLTQKLAIIMRPLLHLLFPDSRKDAVLAGYLSSNITANLLGLGNAATPMGIQAAKRLANDGSGVANNQLCRLIVLNTASIQLIPTNLAAIRVSLGCHSPFDILPAVWITSLCSASIGLLTAWIMGRLLNK